MKKLQPSPCGSNLFNLTYDLTSLITAVTFDKVLTKILALEALTLLL